MPAAFESQPRRFYDGGLPARHGEPAEPPDPARAPRIVLEREGREQFALLRRIAYRDRRLGELLVPADPGVFRTDLTSVPRIFTWLVPRTGAVLPAALIHDGLVHAPDEPPSYVSTDGHVVDRVAANRVFRDAMADTGTEPVRRWLAWSAVTTVTLLGPGGAGWSPLRRWGHRAAVLVTLLVVAALGVLATLDLLDVAGSPQLWWMGERPWWQELLGGLSGALVIPLLLGLGWGSFRVAGWVVGTGLAVLLHVTVGVLLVTGLYRVVERMVARRPLAAAVLGSVLVAGAVGVLLVLVAG